MSAPTQPAAATERADDEGARPLALEVRDLQKRFLIPEHRIDTFKERIVHPLSRSTYRELRALEGVSFDVHRGEFLGIVGRNGSGKSTLLKILASIYRADGGTIRMAGRMAPFIELGVGFDPNLSAIENVVLNGVMMGLTPAQARERIDAVFEFAELEEFRELKLKNYSSGMTVRLAFSVMLQADADILLIDEVLAVGDAAFQQKCADVFHEMRDSDKTVVLVTHDMLAVETYCHRAMLLHDGKLISIGEPEEIGRDYIRLNFAGEEERRKASTVSYEGGGPRWAAVPEISARLVSSHLEGADGEPVANVEQGEPIRLRATLEARADQSDPVLAMHCTNSEGTLVFTLHRQVEAPVGEAAKLRAGERLEISGEIANGLVPGRYFINCWITSKLSSGENIAGNLQLIDFVVYGTPRELGVVYIDSDLRVRPAGEGEE